MNARILAALLVAVVTAAALAAVLVESRRADPPDLPQPAPAAPAPTSRAAAQPTPEAQAEPQQSSEPQQAAAPLGQVAPAAEPEPEPEPVAQAAPESEPEPAPEPASAPVPPPAATAAELRVSPTSIRQGETIAVLVADGPAAQTASATLRVRGAASDMLRVGDHWYAVQPFAPDTPIGEYAVQVRLHDDAGALTATLAARVQIIDADVPLEEIYIGEGTGDPIDREALLEDIRVRFEDHAAVTGPPRWSGPWLRPVAGPDNGRFGAMRSYNGQPPTGWHHGHDIAADHGDPVVAPAPARVAWTGELVIHGIGVILDHGAGVYSGYWHLSLIAVEVGQELAAGDWLGNIGSTGLSTGPHLHWEVIVRGQDVEPLQWLGDQRPPLPGESSGG